MFALSSYAEHCQRLINYLERNDKFGNGDGIPETRFTSPKSEGGKWHASTALLTDLTKKMSKRGLLIPGTTSKQLREALTGTKRGDWLRFNGTHRDLFWVLWKLKENGHYTPPKNINKYVEEQWHVDVKPKTGKIPEWGDCTSDFKRAKKPRFDIEL